MKFKKGDKVKVITGDNKGVEGGIISYDALTSRVTVEGVNVLPKKNKDPRTGKVEVVMTARAIHASNVKKM